MWASTQGVCILCRNRERKCAGGSEHIFLCFSKCVAAPKCISMFLKNVRPLLKDFNEQLLLKENLQLIFFLCVAASRNISMFFNERAAASEKIFNDCF